MNINSFMPARIISGKDCFNRNYGLLSSFGKKCLIVTGGSSAVKSGALADVEKALNGLGTEYLIFSGIGQNPLTTDCHAAGKAASDFGADYIIGIGGGSPLDAAKAVAIYAANPYLSPADIYLRKYENEPIPVILIGTTSGTGSEVTGVSVLTNADTGFKKSISGPDCYAKISFCDYTYTCSMPYSVTVSTALDAFAHSVESYLAKSSNGISELYAERAIAAIFPYLEKWASGDSEISENDREELYISSLFGGLAINITGTCFPHTVGYVLTEDYSVPHGRACTAFMPELINAAEKNCPDRLASLLKAAGTDIEHYLEVIEKLTDVSVKMTAEQTEAYASRWKNGVKNFDRTPGCFTYETARDALGKYL